jgi:uncharacterized protein (DUF1778 family)
MAEGKSRALKARVSETEYQAIQRAADDAGLTVSAFLRSLLLEGAGVKPFLTEHDRAVVGLLVEDMRAIGVNLNQVARALNSKRAVHPDELSISLSNVEAIAAQCLLELRSFAKRAGQQRRGEA